MPRVTPQQQKCWDAYIDPTSPTFGNLTASAKSAGFSEEYGSHIAAHEWFQGLDRRLKMRPKAEMVLQEMLEMPVTILHHEGRGEDAVEYVATDPALVKIKQDSAKFIVSRLGKDDWSDRSEITGADGAPLVDPLKKKESDELIDGLLTRRNAQ